MEGKFTLELDDKETQRLADILATQGGDEQGTASAGTTGSGE
jgi:hypothetical protein